MKIDWKKVLFDCLKVILGAIAGATATTGCAFIPTFAF